MAGLADNKPSGGLHVEGDQQTEGKTKRRRSLETLRKKRILRNLKKKEAIQQLSRKERRERIINKQAIKYRDQVSSLERKLELTQIDYEREKQLSYYSWRKWKEARKNTTLSSTNIRRIHKKSLHGSWDTVIGKGCFGECIMMHYRNITVAVKQFKPHVKKADVLWEASALNKLDHPGLPLLLGVCLTGNPYLLVTQFHGIESKCVTMRDAVHQKVLTLPCDVARIFKEVADGLDHIHSRSLIHNDIKSDNVIITDHGKDTLHPVIVDFGKCRKADNAKYYKLNQEEQKKYRKRYFHIAPELVRGTHKQSFKSDVYSFGVMIGILPIKYRQLHELSKDCRHENPGSRPTVHCIQGILLAIMIADVHI